MKPREKPTFNAVGEFTLTRREAQVLQWVATGKTNTEIATNLGLSPRTVQKHLEHIFRKLRVKTRTAAAMHSRRKNA